MTKKIINNIKKMTAPTTSPLPEQAKGTEEVKGEVLMDFYEALRALSGGKKINRVEWKDKGFYGILKDGIVTLHKPEDSFHSWIINDGDLNGINWIILD